MELALLFAALTSALVAAAPTGKYEGSVPFIIDINLDISSAKAADLDINIKVAHQEVNCPGEAIAMTATAISFPNTGNTGDCMGDALRGQKKDVTKYSLDINSDGTLTFHSDGYPDMKLSKKSLAIAVPSGKYEGSVPFVIDINLDISSATAADLDINMKLAHLPPYMQEVNCPGEAIAMTATAITFPNFRNTGDCMGDALRGRMHDVTRYFLDINSDGTLTFHSDGYPDLKMTKKVFAATAPSGKYEGSVPFIIDINLEISSATAADLDINIKVAHQEVNCPGEAISMTATAITFPTTGNTGDCMGDALRGQKKDVTKYSLDINSDGTLTFHSDGYPDMKLSKKSVATFILV